MYVRKCTSKTPGGANRVLSNAWPGDACGLYDDRGLLNYVGRCGVRENGREMAELLKPIVGGPGFTGNAPGGEGRWSGRERKHVPLRPTFVAEVSADHIENGRFRHGSRLLRWWEDKPPKNCNMDQLDSRRRSCWAIRSTFWTETPTERTRGRIAKSSRTVWIRHEAEVEAGEERAPVIFDRGEKPCPGSGAGGAMTPVISSNGAAAGEAATNR